MSRSSAAKWSQQVRPQKAVNPDPSKSYTLNMFFGDFLNCVGEHFDLDLSSARNRREDRFTRVQVSGADYEEIFSDEHPHIRFRDVEDMDMTLDLDDDEIYTITMNTHRLQDNLEQYVVEHMPRLFRSKFAIAMDESDCRDTLEDIFETLHDYHKAGLIKLRDGQSMPSSEQLEEILETAWNQAVSLASRPAAGSNRPASTPTR